MKIFIKTFGCQMNKLDSELVLGRFLEKGYSAAKSELDADVILINTCSVRLHAEDRAYSVAGSLKPLKKKKPNLRIGIIGCMAQKDKDAIIKKLPHIDIVCGTYELHLLPELVEKSFAKPVVAVDEIETSIDPQERTKISGKNGFQSFLSIMRGCNCKCSYCIVPSVRGDEICRAPEDVCAELASLARNGCLEATLLGQNITSYKYKAGGKASTLADLLRMADKVEGVKRIRFITSHPAFVTEDLFRAINETEKVCEFFHVPAQTGSNRLLKDMRRGYTKERYLEMVELGRRIAPEIEFASDFIVGYPGETDADFEQTVDLMKQARFAGSFIFKYSPRPGTISADMQDDVPIKVKKERNQVLLKLQAEISLEKNRALIGKEVEILVEGKSRIDASKQTGRTRQNQIVAVESAENQTGKLVTVSITDCTALTLFGAV
ncbi:MAG: tRNA (N6-isopentenyl adenosine(37)-C2)-methylthiotransferase MiaB [Planctomycetes bacterium]|nr:tRNA (N6-isopentenyl adenosine(37)-C2)-methylthiotransferase MiaB [Planctomycetota bacterium]